MPLLPADLIRTARDGHPSFTRDAHPDPVLVRALAGEQRRLVGKIALANPHAIAVEMDPIDVSAYDFSAGVALPAHHHVHDPATATGRRGDSAPVYKVSHANRNTARPRYSFSVHGGRLYLSGQGIEWAQIQTVSVSYTPIPGDVPSLSTPLILPDSADTYLVRFLEVVMGKRRPRPGGEPIELRQMIHERDAAEVDLLGVISDSYRAVYMRPVRRR